MPYIITSLCTNDGACVEVCPVACIHTTPGRAAVLHRSRSLHRLRAMRDRLPGRRDLQRHRHPRRARSIDRGKRRLFSQEQSGGRTGAVRYSVGDDSCRPGLRAAVRHRSQRGGCRRSRRTHCRGENGQSGTAIDGASLQQSLHRGGAPCADRGVGAAGTPTLAAQFNGFPSRTDDARERRDTDLNGVTIVGAIGVAGASRPEQDVLCCRAAMAVWESPGHH